MYLTHPKRRTFICCTKIDVRYNCLVQDAEKPRYLLWIQLPQNFGSMCFYFRRVERVTMVAYIRLADMFEISYIETALMFIEVIDVT